MNAGKDVVDELLSIGAVDDARRFMEQTLIPGIAEYRLVEEVIPLRAQYAVVLAYAGEVNRARAELEQLRAFESSSPILAAELANQRRLVEAIGSSRHRLSVRRERNLDESGMLIDVPRLGSGRNEKCPCGSTLKVKRCCGR
ncbi:MAG: SEC-C metal-binding domain-containing protein [Vicinamibacteraceae bacterium]